PRPAGHPSLRAVLAAHLTDPHFDARLEAAAAARTSPPGRHCQDARPLPGVIDFGAGAGVG
ncbi:hypothetical protein, partial [Kitasatospora sp. NPDC088779]|uniref:hypothetical protein n=1 Tax=Kitasatospora sp. NPDC088779 TaxID=3154964 RepID=UPI003429C65D